NTSPCSNGFIVPGSTLMYGSSLIIVTRRPRHLSNRPSEEAVRPLPSEEETPPVTKTYLVTPGASPASPYRSPRQQANGGELSAERSDPLSFVRLRARSSKHRCANVL